MVQSKNFSAYKTIGEVVKIINSENPNHIKINTHTLRFWESQFSQLKPKIFENKRRYYDSNSIELIRYIKFLLKSEGMTIDGVKKVLNGQQSLELDEMANNSIKADNLRNKLVKISKIVKNLKELK